MNHNVKSLDDNGNDLTQRKVIKESSLSRNTLVPGLQCLVGEGASPGMMIGDNETTVYFMVFVLPYSRLMHVSISVQPVDTQTLIFQHDSAFRYFGGMPQECVYDKTSLVSNHRFYQYATAGGFNILTYASNYPKYKGKIETELEYVKQNGLCGKAFNDWKSLEIYLADWLDTVANKRIHRATRQQPWAHYDREEKATMQPYLTPPCL